MGQAISYTVLIDDAPPPEVVLLSITKIEIEREVNTASMIRLNLNMAVDESGRGWTTIDEGTFGYLTKISILTSTTSSVPKPLVTGYVIDIRPNRSSTPGRSDVEIVAMDAEVLLRSEDVAGRRSNQSDSTIAKTVFRSASLIPVVDDTGNNRDEHDTSSSGSRTEGSLLDELAQRNGFEFRIEPNYPLLPDFGHFHEPRLDDASQGTLNVNLGSASNVAGFSVQDDRRSASAARAATVDARTIQPVSVSAEKTSWRVLGADAFDTSPANHTILSTGGLTAPGELQRMVQAHIDVSNWAVTATGSCSVSRYGEIVRIGSPINVRGAGAVDSGTYYVSAVTYLFTQRDMTQNFTLRRNARRSSGDERFSPLDRVPT